MHFSAYSGHCISHTFFLCPPLALATCGVRGKGGRQGKGVGEEGGGGIDPANPINITSATCGSTSTTVFCISSNKIGFIMKNVSGIEVRGYFMAVTLIFKEEHQFFHTVHLFLSYKRQHLPGSCHSYYSHGLFYSDIGLLNHTNKSNCTYLASKTFFSRVDDKRN